MEKTVESSNAKYDVIRVALECPGRGGWPIYAQVHAWLPGDESDRGTLRETMGSHTRSAALQRLDGLGVLTEAIERAVCGMMPPDLTPEQEMAVTLDRVSGVAVGGHRVVSGLCVWRTADGWMVERVWEVPEAYDDDPLTFGGHPLIGLGRCWVGVRRSAATADAAAKAVLAMRDDVRAGKTPVGDRIGNVAR